MREQVALRVLEDIRWCGLTLFNKGEIVYQFGDDDRETEIVVCADPITQTKQTVLQKRQLEAIKQ